MNALTLKCEHLKVGIWLCSLYMYVFAYMCVCVCIRMYVCIYVCMYVCTYVRAYTYMCMHVYIMCMPNALIKRVHLFIL